MTDAEKELITRAAMLERCLDLEDELIARRAGVNGQITTTAGGSVTYITAGPPAPGPVSIPSVWVSPDFDEPMELVESKRLRYFEEVERAWIHRHEQRLESAAHQATCPNCGAPLSGGTPAADAPKDVSADRGPVPAKDANVAGEDAPSGYMSRDKLL